MARAKPHIQRFLSAKFRALDARAGRLASLTPDLIGLRPEDQRYSPSPAHFEAANTRLAAISKRIAERLGGLKSRLAECPPEEALRRLAMVEREVDRARRTFGMFFEVFSQRGTSFAAALAAHDVIADDCYRAAARGLPGIVQRRLLRPITYLEHGYSPATMRRGVTLGRLLGDSNPFPLIRIPWDRDSPWQVVFLHEVAHNLQADLRIWDENREAVLARMGRVTKDLRAITVFTRWHKEVFADLAALLLGGPAGAWGLMDFLAHPAPRVLTYMPGGAHPTGYFRALILVEMLRRMGFERDADAARKIWQELYDPKRISRIPKDILENAPKLIPPLVDEIAFQPRRNLANYALVDVLPFRRDDEERIRGAADALLQDNTPAGVPPRHLVAASRYALTQGASAGPLSARIVRHLAGIAARERNNPETLAVAA